MFHLGHRSEAELIGVNPALVAVVRRAVELTPVDFGVHDGVRSVAQQRELVRLGASKTMDSRHLTGHAVDLVPYINGKMRWEWEPIYLIAEAVRAAACEQGTAIRWGGAWHTNLTGEIRLTARQLSQQYVELRRSVGKSAYIDGPHYEMPR